MYRLKSCIDFKPYEGEKTYIKFEKRGGYDSCLTSASHCYHLIVIILCLFSRVWMDVSTTYRLSFSAMCILFKLWDPGFTRLLLFQMFFQCWWPAKWSDSVSGLRLWSQGSDWTRIAPCAGILPWTVSHRQRWLCEHLAGSGHTRYVLWQLPNVVLSVTKFLLFV